MHYKIKDIRMQLGLSESQISSLLNISSYKYRRYENGSIDLTVEILILLSIMYGIPIDLVVFDKFSLDTIFKEESIIKILKFSEKERAAILESNMCKFCAYRYNTANYRLIKYIYKILMNNFTKNLYNLRCAKSYKIADISSLLHIDTEYYQGLENGDMWPTVSELTKIVFIYSESIENMLKNNKETSH